MPCSSFARVFAYLCVCVCVCLSVNLSDYFCVCLLVRSELLHSRLWQVRTNPAHCVFPHWLGHSGGGDCKRAFNPCPLGPKFNMSSTRAGERLNTCASIYGHAGHAHPILFGAIDGRESSFCRNRRLTWLWLVMRITSPRLPTCLSRGLDTVEPCSPLPDARFIEFPLGAAMVGRMLWTLHQETYSDSKG